MKSNLTNLAYGQEEPYTFRLNERQVDLNEQRDLKLSSRNEQRLSTKVEELQIALGASLFRR